MTAEQLALEIAKHLPDGGDINIEQSRFWCLVAETLTDDQLSAFLRTANALASPISLLMRELVLAKRKAEATAQ